MHVGRSYTIAEFAQWSRRPLIFMVIVSALAIGFYCLPVVGGFVVPWPVIAILGTTVSLVAGFKNAQVLSRAGDASLIFAQVTASSRMWSSLCNDCTDAGTAKALVYRHLAWLAALRFALRRPMPWESLSRKANVEYRRRYQVLEDTSSLPVELKALLGEEAEAVLGAVRPAARLLDMQTSQVNALFKAGSIPSQVYSEMLKLIRDFHDQQSRADRIKSTPYPRQYAIVSSMFVLIFCTLLPFGVVPIFADMGKQGGVIGMAAIWLTIPFSALLGWMYMSLDQVGESTANPYEGSANDVPISQICRDIEIELRARLGEQDLPKPILPVNGIVI